MTLAKPLRMDADTFRAWAIEQEGRYELVGGEVVAIAPERAGHNRAKARAWRALSDAVRANGLPCETYTDGMAVRVDDATVYEPDASVRCGKPLRDDETEISDPVAIIEVSSPSTQSVDLGVKLADYFRLPSVRHYLILRIENRTVIHHARDDSGAIATRILTDGRIEMDPPGLALDVDALF
jgi:Uma2 family endonuclease